MDNLSQDFEGGHPPQEQFLQFVDGELAPKVMSNWQSHLDACWKCRVRSIKIQETITDIIGFEDTIAEFQLNQADQKWGNFNSQLNALVLETKPKQRIRFYWNNFFHFFFVNSIRGMATTSIAVLLIFAIIYQFVFVSTVSANQLLEYAKKSNQDSINSVSHPVVFQKIKVSRGARSSTVELWNQVESKKSRAFGTSTEVLDEYRVIMAKNKFDSQNPLSAEAYQSWHNRLERKRESVSQKKNANGETVFELATITGQERKPGEITSANITVRESDWHTVSQKIQIKTDREDITFQVSELEFRVVNSNTLAKDFFDTDSTFSTVTDGQSVVPAPNGSPESEETNSNSNIDSEIPAETTVANSTADPGITASFDLEVEVLAKLDELNALTGEQIDLSRTRDGKLLLKGIVDTKQRKTEILQALQSYKSNPSVRIDIQSVDEIKAKQNKRQRTDRILEDFQVTSPKFPVEDELQNYFMSIRGMNSEQASAKIRQLSSNVLASSGQARSSASALKQIAARFAGQDISKMDEASRAKWRGLIAGHARKAQRSLQNLKQQVTGIFPTSEANVSFNIATSKDEEIGKAAQQLFDLIINTDGGLRRSFSLSNDSNRSAPIQSTAFWRSFGKAEKVAAQLATIK